MKASELPADIKREMLERIRDQLGSDEYDKLVKQVGKDGLIDLALQGMEQAAREAKEHSGSDKVEGFLGKMWDKLGWLLGLALVGWGQANQNDGAGGLGGLILIVWLVQWGRNWTRPPK